MAEYVTGTGQRLVSVHDPMNCFGSYCVIHDPMPGPWSSWPTHWREDIRKMQRVCPCGVGHPPAEDWDRLRLLGHPEWQIAVFLVHGCCGRCPCAPEGDFIEGEWFETPRALPY